MTTQRVENGLLRGLGRTAQKRVILVDYFVNAKLTDPSKDAINKCPALCGVGFPSRVYTQVA